MRRELKFQGHIMKSYKNCGGHARKWATNMTVGPPDLVAQIRPLGLHLVEVKHRPNWSVGKGYKNPMTAKQEDFNKDFSDAGAPTFLMVVIGSHEALKSTLHLFTTPAEKIWVTPHNGVPYQPRVGYDIKKLMEGLKYG